jgi:aryl-alcohol dehydrogenase-like predicted oxidoreductase
MRARRIGSLEVSVVGLGCNNFGGRIDADATQAVIDAALEAGITFFDTADIYGNAMSEEFLGKALGSRRDQVVIATKFGMPYAEHPGGAQPAYIRRALEDSLRRLGTDHVDLYQLHQPDPTVGIADTLGTLRELVTEGKVREIGCSNFTSAQLLEAAESGTSGAKRFVSVQNEYSILQRSPEADVLATCDRLQVAFLPYFPLAKGLLTGKYRAGQAPPEGSRLASLTPDRQSAELSELRLAKVAALETLAGTAGHSLLDLAIAWLLAHEQVASVIAGATAPAQVHANVAAADFLPSPEILAGVEKITPLGGTDQ